MERYDPFAEMNRMFEQMRTRTWTPESTGRGGFGGRESLGSRDGFLGGFGDSARGSGGINMDLKKHGEEYVFVADLPGFETEEIDLSFDGEALLVTAESRRSDEMSSGKMASDGTSGGETMSDETVGSEMTSDESMRDETALDRTTTDTDEMAGTDEVTVRRQFTSSRRVSERVTIPEAIVEDEISATYRNGVLEVHLPIVTGEDEDDGKKIDIAD